VSDQNLVMIDLEFGALLPAEQFLARLRVLWAGPGAAVMRNPEAWIVDRVDATSI
jgi:hypothetical protein